MSLDTQIKEMQEKVEEAKNDIAKLKQMTQKSDEIVKEAQKEFDKIKKKKKIIQKVFKDFMFVEGEIDDFNKCLPAFAETLTLNGVETQEKCGDLLDLCKQFIANLLSCYMGFISWIVLYIKI